MVTDSPVKSVARRIGPSDEPQWRMVGTLFWPSSRWGGVVDANVDYAQRRASDHDVHRSGGRLQWVSPRVDAADPVLVAEQLAPEPDQVVDRVGRFREPKVSGGVAAGLRWVLRVGAV